MTDRNSAQQRGEEELRKHAHPLVHFVDGPTGRRASLVGRGLDVWEVVATVRDNDGLVCLAAQYLRVPARLVEAAVAYYGEYQDEIDAEIESNEAAYELLLRSGPDSFASLVGDIDEDAGDIDEILHGR